MLHLPGQVPNEVVGFLHAVVNQVYQRIDVLNFERFEVAWLGITFAVCSGVWLFPLGFLLRAPIQQIRILAEVVV